MIPLVFLKTATLDIVKSYFLQSCCTRQFLTKQQSVLLHHLQQMKPPNGSVCWWVESALTLLPSLNKRF